MFNLKEAITNWRRQMIAGGIKTPGVLDELESHLREDIDQQIKAGLTEESAFVVAIKRLGKSDALYQEFDKVEDIARMSGWEELRRRWLPAGVPLLFIYLATGWSWYQRDQAGKADISWQEFGLGLGALVGLVLLGWAGYSLAKILPVIHPKRFIGIFAILLLCLLIEGAGLRFLIPLNTAGGLVHLQIGVLWMLSPMWGVAICFGKSLNRSGDIRRKFC